IVRVDFPGLLKKIARRRVAFTGELVPLVPASREVIVGSEAVRVFPSQALDLGLSQFAGQTPEGSDDGSRDLVTNGEYALDLPVIAVGPELAPGSCIDQLRPYPHAFIGALYAAVDDVTNVEVLAHLPDVRGLVLVCDGGTARHDDQVGKLGQPGDELLANSIGKILLVVRGTHVVKGQHRDGRVVGEGA